MDSEIHRVILDVCNRCVTVNAAFLHLLFRW